MARRRGAPGPSPRSARPSSALSLGLMELGVEKGDKVAILANTRPEWTYYDFAALSAGATVVPIYQTNSPEECQYVLENSDAKVVVVEDDEQLEKIRQVRDACPKLEHVILMSGSGEDAISTDELIGRGAGLGSDDWEERWSSVTPEDICTFIYTSGTTGPPEGLRDLARQLPRDARHGADAERSGGRARHLPLPAAGPLVRPADPAPELRGRRRARLLGARPAEDPAQPGRGQAPLLPVGAADLREDLHGRDVEGREGRRPAEARSSTGRSGSAAGCARREREGRTAWPPLRAQYEIADRLVLVEDPQPVRRAGSSRRSPAPRRSTPTSCGSSTPRASWCSRAGG